MWRTGQPLVEKCPVCYTKSKLRETVKLMEDSLDSEAGTFDLMGRSLESSSCVGRQDGCFTGSAEKLKVSRQEIEGAFMDFGNGFITDAYLHFVVTKLGAELTDASISSQFHFQTTRSSSNFRVSSNWKAFVHHPRISLRMEMSISFATVRKRTRRTTE